jgi:flagellar basal-body rod protein FlgB
MPRKLFDRTIDFVRQSLDARSTRHKVLSNNIANAGTPDYRSMDIPFQKVLESSLGAGANVQLIKTHPAHFPESLERSIEPESSSEGVNLDQEMANLAENNLMFQAGVQALVKKLEALKATILDGGR